MNNDAVTQAAERISAAQNALASIRTSIREVIPDLMDHLTEAEKELLQAQHAFREAVLASGFSGTVQSPGGPIKVQARTETTVDPAINKTLHDDPELLRELMEHGAVTYQHHGALYHDLPDRLRARVAAHIKRTDGARAITFPK